MAGRSKEMSDLQAERILQSMINFIEQHGKEQVKDIELQSANEFTISSTQYLEAEKAKIVQNFEAKKSNQEIELKIKKSMQQNKARIERMKAVNIIVEKLRTELKERVQREMSQDQGTYKKLLKALLIQVSISLWFIY